MTTRSAASIERRLGAARGEQPPGHLLGVAPVHLAAERPDEEPRQACGASGRNSVEPRVIGRERIARSGGRGAGGDEVEHGQRARRRAKRHGSGMVRRRGRATRERRPVRAWASPYHRPMELLTNPETWIALLTLTVLEIVLGIDNVIFISILVQRLPTADRDRARLVGLGLAMGMRILLLLTISWIVGLTQPVFTIAGHRVLVARPDPHRRRPVPDLEGDHRDPRGARGRGGRTPSRRDRRRRSARCSSRSCCSTSSSRSTR